MNSLFKELERKISRANLSAEIIRSSNPKLDRMLQIMIPKANEFEAILFYEKDEELDYILNSNFENFRFIRGFEGVWSEKQSKIECELAPIEFLPNEYILEMINSLVEYTKGKIKKESRKSIENVNLIKQKDFDASIGYCSKEFVVLFRAKERRFYPFKNLRMQTITLKVNNIRVDKHDRAFELLNKISNSILFQLESFLRYPLVLVNEKESIIERDKELKNKFTLSGIRPSSLDELQYEYDTDPMALYWFAKSSPKMPLFQYLAFYQVIEYYFPIFSTQKAKQKIQNYIKDPRFNPNKDEDIIKILSVARDARNKGVGSEKEQLKNSIASCLDNTELREYFEADEEKYSFYLNHKGKCLSKQKISLRNKNADLVNEVAERIYEIRCRIVHRKVDENELGLILPYSPEVKVIKHDLDLIEYIARKILVDRSKPFRL